MNTDERIREIMHAAVEDIKSRMDAAGVNASGRTRNSLQVRRMGAGQYQIIQYGSRFAPFYTIENGRKAGKVPAGFTDILVQWSRDKGLSFSSEKERRRFAYLLGRKIATEGTPRPNTDNPRPLDIMQPVMNKANRDIRIAITETMTGFIGAHMRYAVDSIKVGAKKVSRKISDFFRWG